MVANDGKKRAENALARILSLEVIISLIGGAFMVGMIYMSLQSDIVTAQITADAARTAAAAAEQHSKERAAKDEKQLKEIAADISGIKANQAGFVEAMRGMKEGQIRIEGQLQMLLQRGHHNGGG